MLQSFDCKAWIYMVYWFHMIYILNMGFRLLPIRNVIGRKNRTLLKMQAGLCEGIPPFFRERRSGCGFLHDEFDSEYIY